MMKLYRLHWNGYSWDQYIGAVVVAESEEEARKIHPGFGEWGDTWCERPEDVTLVTYIGEAASDFKRGDVVLSSFHAG
jgi:hypothetical protein